MVGMVMSDLESYYNKSSEVRGGPGLLYSNAAVHC